MESLRAPARRSPGRCPGQSAGAVDQGPRVGGEGRCRPSSCPPTSQDPSAGVPPAPGPHGLRGLRQGPSSGVSARAPGVWPCARPCALARSLRERLHGCCVGRPAPLDAAGWGNTVASFPAGGGPVRGADCASRTWRGAGVALAAPEGPRGDRRALPKTFPSPSRVRAGCAAGLAAGRAKRHKCLHTRPRCAGRSVPAPPENGRMSPVGRGWADGFADIPTVLPVRCRPWPDPGRCAGTGAGTQRAASVTPLRSEPARADRSRNARSGCRSPAFARGACTRDVRRP